MRVPRFLVLEPGAAFHLWWRGHNREFVLRSHNEKSRYLQALVTAFQRISRRFPVLTPSQPPLRLFSFCLMSNHAHLCGQIHPDAPSLIPLSRLFQSAHAVFARWYNRLHKRSGKVAEERFHSRLVQNDQALQIAMLYSDANPVVAGIVKHPKDYPWSSYGFYAYGLKVPGHQLLTFPGWYLELGSTPARRRARYRRLVDLYLRGKKHRPATDERPQGYFLGSPDFVDQRSRALAAVLKRIRFAICHRPP